MFTRRICQPFLVMLVLALPGVSFSQEISQTAIDKAHNFLKTSDRGRQINHLMHFGTTYTSHEAIEVLAVKDAAGRLVPGEFAISYRFWWDREYSTDLLVFCTASGSISGIRATRSDGIAQAPFLASQATIALIGNVIYEAFKNDMSETERAQLRQIIEQADTKSLLEMQLKLQQALGQ